MQGAGKFNTGTGASPAGIFVMLRRTWHEKTTI